MSENRLYTPGIYHGASVAIGRPAEQDWLDVVSAEFSEMGIGNLALVLRNDSAVNYVTAEELEELAGEEGLSHSPEVVLQQVTALIGGMITEQLAGLELVEEAITVKLDGLRIDEKGNGFRFAGHVQDRRPTYTLQDEKLAIREALGLPVVQRKDPDSPGIRPRHWLKIGFFELGSGTSHAECPDFRKQLYRRMPREVPLLAVRPVQI